jgi:hypothetical protein
LLTAAERTIIRRHRTPRAVQQWLRSLRYNWERTGPTLRSFRGVVRRGSAHCLEGALAAATILEFHGHPPLLLDLESQDWLDHVVFVFRRNGRFGAVGTSRDVGLWGRKPVFRSVRRLAMSYYEPYIDLHARITAFALIDLRDLERCAWRFSARNVWKVERFLLATPHAPLVTDDRRYIRLRERYREFTQAHDPRDTPFKHGKHHWM